MKTVSLHHLLLVFCCAVAWPINAIEISSMFEVFNDGKARITVKNTDKQRIFLFVGMSRLNVIDGEIRKTEYTKENLSEWEILVSPAKTIIEPGFEKQLNIEYQCKYDCDSVKDKLFQLSIVPAPYVAEGEGHQNMVQIAVGFAPILVQVNQEQALDYEIEHQGQQVILNNRGNSHFQATLSSCDDKQQCLRVLKVLAGRKLKFQLPENMANQPLELTLISVSGEHQDQFPLKFGQVVEAK